MGATSLVKVGTSAGALGPPCWRALTLMALAAASVKVTAAIGNCLRIMSAFLTARGAPPPRAGAAARNPRLAPAAGAADSAPGTTQLALSTTAYCCFCGSGVGGCEGLKRRPVYCISSHVWSPHFTSTFGSGFALLPGELSYHAVEMILAPLGSRSGSLNM